MPQTGSKDRKGRRPGEQEKHERLPTPQGIPSLSQARPVANQGRTSISSPRARNPRSTGVTSPATAPRTPTNRVVPPPSSTRPSASSQEEPATTHSHQCSGAIANDLESTFFAIDSTPSPQNIARIEWLVKENQKLVQAYTTQRAEFDHLQKLSNRASSLAGGGRDGDPLNDLHSLMEAIAESSNTAMNESVMQMQQLGESIEAMKMLLAARGKPEVFKARFEAMVGPYFPSVEDRQARAVQRASQRSAGRR